MKSLSMFLERGAYPEELLLLDIREVREVYYIPYRIFYRIVGQIVQILAIADGCRDLQAFLVERMLSDSSNQ